MADITLAEYQGNAWLVSGEGHIDDLLANTLPKEITIELVACGTREEVQNLWVQNCGPPQTDADPWMIHPAIVARVRRSVPDNAVFFAQWSALIDQDAITVIHSAALWAHENPGSKVLITEYLDAEGPQVIADLSRLRSQLVKEKLIQEGIPQDRIEHVKRSVSDVPGMTQESQRIDISLRPN